MANNSGDFNATPFIIGALVVAIVGFAAYYFEGFGKDEADIKLELPDVKGQTVLRLRAAARPVV